MHLYEEVGVADGKYRIVCTKLLQPKIGDVVAKDGMFQCFCMKKSDWRMESIGSLIPRNPNVGWVVTVRRMGGSRAFVWCGQRKVYRLSENTL